MFEDPKERTYRAMDERLTKAINDKFDEYYSDTPWQVWFVIVAGTAASLFCLFCLWMGTQ